MMATIGTCQCEWCSLAGECETHAKMEHLADEVMGLRGTVERLTLERDAALAERDAARLDRKVLAEQHFEQRECGGCLHGDEPSGSLWCKRHGTIIVQPYRCPDWRAR